MNKQPLGDGAMKFTPPKNYEKNNPNILKRVVKDMESNKPFHYLFIGNAGVGKTALAKLIRRSYSESDWRWLNVRKFYRNYIELMSTSYNDKYDVIRDSEKIMRAKNLVIDDLGNERPNTASAHDYMGSMLEERYDWLTVSNKEARTIITTNLGANELHQIYGARLIDRLEGLFTIMRFKNQSFRRVNREIIEG